jgi:uncharacterized membrane protein
MDYKGILEIIGLSVDGIGVFVIIFGAIYSTFLFVERIKGKYDPYKTYRQNIGRVILLGLEFLVAGDIIRSVAIQPSFSSVGILAVIVIIRSILSIELEMEITGKWPWQKNKPSVKSI